MAPTMDQELYYLIFMTMLRDRHYLFHFKDEETVTKRG